MSTSSTIITHLLNRPLIPDIDLPVSPKSFKIAVPIFIASIFSALVPQIFGSFRVEKSYFALANVFTGGIQLATICADIIPHMIEGDNHGSQLPFITIGICFLLLVAVDSIFLHGNKRQGAKPKSGASNTTHSHGISHETTGEEDEEEHCSHHHTAEDHNGCHQSLGTCNTNAIASTTSVTQAFLTIFAISLHSFFEGFGINKESVQSFTYLLGIFFHKILESFAVGTSMKYSPLPTYSKMILLTFYSCLTPIGIMMSDIEKMDDYRQWSYALSLGAMMFVVFFEIVGHSFHGGKDTFRKIICILLGYALGCAGVLAAHAGHNHSSHGHHEHSRSGHGCDGEQNH